MSVVYGGCFILLRRFSSRNFWRDCYESKATRILYVGELCRYLLATPESEYDKRHQVQVARGNGMKAEVWDKFKSRFNIPIIWEFYRSTEVIFLNFQYTDNRELPDMIIYKKAMVFGDLVELVIVVLLDDSLKIQHSS
jgi:acyl-CoA synthetase (AMP-forming)/AMP-acid ligase II